MPRTYIKKGHRPVYSDNDLTAALQEVSFEANIRVTSKKFNIPYTALQKHHTAQVWYKGPGRATHFTDLEETYLVGAVTVLQKLVNSSAVRKVNIIKGFMNTGIYPLDRMSINSAKILKCNNKIEKDIALPKHPKTSIDSSDDDDEEDNIPIASRLTADVPLDLSFPMKSSLEITYSKALPSSPTRTIRRTLCSIRPSATEQPPAKKIVLEREASQLLTDEQVLQQLKEKEERALKAKRVTTQTLKPPTTKTKQKKILTTIHELTDINTLSTT
ncbi:unnamed protein product [Didymodactylos carnosus]|uniref:Uncharacterized protein n=1 Tax=Didymodactylos carnosus TaxID=1234261 RepID=A0A8S2TKX5_9BILA|nr:unnamed protein product [Didymodactylos carnosus]CAF4295995.1 unnamed protein product [Didymodactylos carnosus]